MKTKFTSLALLITALTASALPVITQEPADLTATNGGPAQFHVSVSGAGPFSYQWLLNGTNLPLSITTVAGTGVDDYTGDGGPATNATLNYPSCAAMDGAGNLFIADTVNNRIRKVSPDGVITTVAGSGSYGYSGNGGPATNASLALPFGMAVDDAGNIYFSESDNFVIRSVGTNGLIARTAGIGGAWGNSGDGGPATDAKLDGVRGLAMDGAGNLFIADINQGCIRKVATNGIITTVAGNGGYGYSGDGGAATNAELALANADGVAGGVAADSAGNLYIADIFNNRIRKVGTNGVITTVAGNGLDDYSGDGGAATNAALNNPAGVAVDSAGNLFIADYYNDRIRRVTPNGTISTVAGVGTNGFSGDGGPPLKATLSNPCGLAMDRSGSLFIMDYGNNRLRRMNSAFLPSLSLNHVSGMTKGNYSVVITDSSGSVTSRVASLNVVLPITSFTATNIGRDLNIRIAGPPNYQYCLETATNLSPPAAWQPVVTNQADANGHWSFTISNAMLRPAGYYRAALP